MLNARFLRLIFLLLLMPLSMLAQPKGVRITKNADRNTATEKTRILFIVDCSYNMYEKWQSDTKIKITQSLISNIVDTLSLEEGTEYALRVFGSEKDYSSQDCEDTKLLVPFYRLNTDAFKSKLKALVPKGSAVVASSLEKATEDFPKEKRCRNIVIMIVDNIDRCGRDINTVSQNLQTKGVCLKPFIVGINRGMKDFYQKSGLYYEANNEVEFSKIMNNIVKQALHNTTVQVNLLDKNMESTETNVPVTFADSKSKQTKYSFFHTFNSKGVSDTVSVDPLSDYDVTVHTIPPVKKNNVRIEAGAHTVIPLQTPQGSLLVKYSSEKNDLNIKSYPVLVRKSGDKETINIHSVNKKEKYLVGRYDLEVLSQPRLRIDDVEIGQSSLTTVEIPLSGVLAVDKVKAGVMVALFAKEKDGLVLVLNLNEEKTKENIELLPGEYTLVARERDTSETEDNIVQEVKIESNKTTVVSLFVKKDKKR